MCEAKCGGGGGGCGKCSRTLGRKGFRAIPDVGNGGDWELPCGLVACGLYAGAAGFVFLEGPDGAIARFDVLAGGELSVAFKRALQSYEGVTSTATRLVAYLG